MIKNNVFENITSHLCLPGGCKNCAGQPPRALHSDDGMSGWTVVDNTFVNCTKVHNAYSSRDITFVNNRIAHIHLSEVNRNQHSATQLDVMPNDCSHPSSTQYRFLHRVPYNSTPYTKYPHLANILSDDPCTVRVPPPCIYQYRVFYSVRIRTTCLTSSYIFLSD